MGFLDVRIYDNLKVVVLETFKAQAPIGNSIRVPTQANA